MARLLFCDPGSLLAYKRIGTDIRSAAGETAIFYEDSAGTTLADMAEYDSGNPNAPGPVIASSELTVDTYSQIPWFWGPASGLETLYVTVNSGPLTRIDAYYDPRIDDVAGDLSAHEADTTNVHGIADTSLLVSAATIDAKGDLLVGTAADTLTRLPTAANGRLLMTASDTSTGLEWADVFEMAGYLTTGQETFHRLMAAAATITMPTQRARFSYFTARKTETITSIRFVTGTTGASATPSLVKFAIFTVAGNGDLTRVGITASHTATFATPATAYDLALLVSVPVTRGSRYALGALVVTAVAAPTVVGNAAPNATTEAARAPRFATFIDAQADFATGYTAGSLTDSVSTPYAVAVP